MVPRLGAPPRPGYTPLTAMWEAVEPGGLAETSLGLGNSVRELGDLLPPLVTGWISDALVRGVALGLEFPSRISLLPGEITPVRMLLDGLVGDAIAGAASPGGAVHVRVWSPTPAVLRVAVRRTHGARRGRSGSGEPRPHSHGRKAALDRLREVVRSHCGRLFLRRGRNAETVRVDLPRVA